MTVVRPGELRPASRTADLICAEATGVRYSIGSGLARAAQRDGAAPALGLRQHLRAHQRQRIENAAHGPLAQGGVAVERRGRWRGRRRRPSSAASPVPALPKSRTPCGCSRRADAARRRTRQRPAPSALHDGAQRARRPPRCAARPRPPAGPRSSVRPVAQQPEDQGAVRDRLVARRPRGGP